METSSPPNYPVVTDERPPAYDELREFDQAVLSKGIRVALTKDSSSEGKISTEEYGLLTLATADLKFAAKKPKGRFITTYLSSILDVELQQQAIPGQSTRCRIVLKEGAGASFSFFCTDAVGGISSPDLTTFAANVLKNKVGELKDKKDSGKIYIPPSPKKRPTTMAPPPTTFEELLDPLGLTDKYCAAFTASRIPIQNLGVVTREDLAELVGVTDRLDQINISAEIKRCFPERVVLISNSGGSNASRFETGVKVVEGASQLLGAFIG